jgi:hypothetical protein
MINHVKFSLNMIRKYERKYPQIPTDILVDIIDVVLNQAPDSYFTYQQVQEHPEFCIRCGKCCENLGCSSFDGRLCAEYESRYDACREFPFYEINNTTGLMLDCECHFANCMAEKALDEEFERNFELLNSQ